MSARRRSLRARRAHGYTIIEVIMALSVLAVGAVGVIGLQKATLVANNNARMLNGANAIATAWAERLHADAMVWNLPANAPADTADAVWVNWGATHLGQWVTLAAIANANSVADPLSADIWGGADVSPPAFCTNVRFTSLNNANTRLRAEIRVVWDRTSTQINCGGIGQNPPNPVTFGSVYVTTILTPNILPQ